MFDNNSFYVTLLSNDTSFYDNKISKYVTLLPHTIKLRGDWEVGLTELIYTKSYYTISEDIELTFYTESGPFRLVKPCMLKRGNYPTPERLATAINSAIRRVLGDNGPEVVLNADYTVRIRRGEMVIAASGKHVYIGVYLGVELEDMLGLSDLDEVNYSYKWTLNSTTEEERPDFWSNRRVELGSVYRNGNRLYDMKNGFHALMVYSDVAAPSICGSMYAPLLRVLKVEDGIDFGADINCTFTNPYYVPVSSNEIPSIEINIKNESGEFVHFEFGRCTAVLHFRQKKWRPII